MADILSQEEIDALLSDLIRKKALPVFFPHTLAPHVCGFASHGVFPSMGTPVDNRQI
ncbi:hypothetical protein [Geovibrio thiophilus]|uniref:hypothetical protein n=1 Tax=Geovibrio thiophilus TaxID=139438 RepID=UPI0013E404E9|nr:hypothetical protein [Geovibrio thiophilus]